MSSEISLPCPSTFILAHSRAGLLEYQGPPSISNTDGTPVAISPIRLVDIGSSKMRLSPNFSPNGRFVAIVPDESPIMIFDAKSGVLISQIDCVDALEIEFSPLGNFVTTFSRHRGSAESSEGNQRVWNSADGALVSQFSQRVYKKQSVQWTADEQFFLRMVSNEVHLYPIRFLSTGPYFKLVHKGLVSFRVSPTSDPLHVVVFNPEISGNPARATLYRLSTSGEAHAEVATRTVFSANEAAFYWNSIGTTVLIHTHADVDASNTSYYGATRLALLSVTGSSGLVTQSKEGPIYDVRWSPIGDRFVVAAGNMPAQTTLYNEAGSPVYEFGAAHRNTISWSPHGRFLCIAGFGNLAGEMDFYDTVKLKKIGSNMAHCSVSHGWSPDSRYFLTAILTPRMNVDNGFKIFKYNGVGPVVHISSEQLYSVQWRPEAPGVYPNRGQSPKRVDPTTDGSAASVAAPAATAKPKAAPYRPPGSTGSLSDLMRRESGGGGAPVGKVKPVVGAPAKPTSAPVPQRRIPGLAPTPTPPPEKKKVAPPAVTQTKALASPAVVVVEPPRPPPAAETIPIESMTPEDKVKRAKAIRKKLKQITEIKEKLTGGQPLNEDQQSKINSESELLAELEKLEIL